MLEFAKMIALQHNIYMVDIIRIAVKPGYDPRCPGTPSIFDTCRVPGTQHVKVYAADGDALVKTVTVYAKGGNEPVRTISGGMGDPYALAFGP